MDEQHGATPPGPDPGSSPLAEEATRLFGAVQQWAQQTFPAPADGHGGPDCQWCPICQFMAVLRGERPDVTERVSEAGTAVLSAVRALADAAGAARGTSSPEPTHPGVQHIDLGDAKEPR